MTPEESVDTVMVPQGMDSTSYAWGYAAGKQAVRAEVLEEVIAIVQREMTIPDAINYDEWRDEIVAAIKSLPGAQPYMRKRIAALLRAKDKEGK